LRVPDAGFAPRKATGGVPALALLRKHDEHCASIWPAPSEFDLMAQQNLD